MPIELQRQMATLRKKEATEQSTVLPCNDYQMHRLFVSGSIGAFVSPDSAFPSLLRNSCKY